MPTVRKIKVCRIRDCEIEIAPRMLMCRDHWFMVPNRLRAAIWATVPRVGETPSQAYALNVREAVHAVQNALDALALTADELEGLDNAEHR